MSDGLSAKLAWTEADPDEDLIASATIDLAMEDGREADREEWPSDLWSALEQVGGPRWSLPDGYGGSTCPRSTLVQRYARLASGSLTAVFILSQHEAALRRLTASMQRPAADRWMREVGRNHA